MLYLKIKVYFTHKPKNDTNAFKHIFGCTFACFCEKRNNIFLWVGAIQPLFETAIAETTQRSLRAILIWNPINDRSYRMLAGVKAMSNLLSPHQLIDKQT